jgi:hypothetical protein
VANDRRIFLHDQNEDGDFESVCPDCLHTVATESFESDLYHAEFLHICDLETIRRLWGIKNFSQ